MAMTTEDAQPPLTINDVSLDDVNKYDIWDKRESAVANPQAWRRACTAYKASAPEFAAGIPHTLHQIWIGSREPPCVWLDTWRIDFMQAFAEKLAQPTWEYRLWDNDSVAHIRMQNQHIFDCEEAPQCQADILRLEVLYQYGGVYVDADIVSTVRDLRPALDAARETGFLITYEPDTKDKPYSILGNSIIACTPKHPLILMLMSYIKHIYPLKRAHYGVEWVTGPLTYTKVLVHTDMPVYIPPSKHFYPAFHYIPNPSAIDVSQFDSYCFQFGYTCSGLSDWVSRNNKCKHAHGCSHHAGLNYAFGKLRQFPELPAVSEGPEAIPNTIHQIWLQDTPAPTRWMHTWEQDFCPSAGYQYELWTPTRLREQLAPLFCANLYANGRLDEHAMHLLALEILHVRGGYYVPLTTTFDKGAASRGQAASPTAAGVIATAGITALHALKRAYDTGLPAALDGSLPTHDVRAMRFSDTAVQMARFRRGSRFLGASSIEYAPAGMPDARKHRGGVAAALSWAYDCQVPLFRGDAESALRRIQNSDGRTVVVTDADFGLYSRLIDELPGILYRLDEQNTAWDFVVLNLEWLADADELAVYPASCGVLVPTSRYFGFVVNSGAGHLLDKLCVETVLRAFDCTAVTIASEKSPHGEQTAMVFRALPVLHDVCTRLADYVPDVARDYEETHGDVVKGFRDGQIAFELQVDEQGGVLFRSWRNCSIDCECRFRPGVGGTDVEFLRCYDEGGRVLHDISAEHVVGV